MSGTKTTGESAKKSEAGNQVDVPSANDLKQVSEIILAHDDRKGSATMAQKVFQDLLAKEALTMPIRKSHINDLHANASSLVITKEALTPQAQTSAPEAIHLCTADEEKIVTVLFGIAGKGEDHLQLVQQIALFCSDIDNVVELADALDKEEIAQSLTVA